MEISPIDDNELKSTEEEDQYWLTLKEESIIFNEGFVCSKFNELVDDKEFEVEEEEDETTTAQSTTKDEKKLELAQKLIGLVEVEESNFKTIAIQQWTKELIDACNLPRDSASSFLGLIRKRLEVLQRLHKAHIRDRERLSRTKTGVSTTAGETEKELESNVPVVVRLGVLTLFPLIESLHRIKDANYSQLCSQILDMLLKVLSTLPPLALNKEPADCLNAFQDFIFSLVKNQNFQIDSDSKAQTVVALVGMGISRGNAKDLLLIADVLFNIHKTMNQNKCELPIGSYLKQLSNYRKDQDISVLFERGYIADFNVTNISVEDSTANARNDAIACDGSFIYMHSFGKGLSKIGTGYGGTIKGHVYEHNQRYRRSDKQKTMACIGDKLYYLLPQLESVEKSVVVSPSVNLLPSVSLGRSQSFLPILDILPHTTVDAPPSENKPKSNDEEVADSRLQLAIINTQTLTEEGIVVLKENVSSRGYLISDGKLLYVITKKSKKGSEKGKEKNENSQEDQFIVEIFDPLNLNMTLINTIELDKVISDPKAVTKHYEPALQPLHWKKSAFYTTGYQLVALIPADNGTTYTKSRLFSLLDGKHIGDVEIQSEPLSLVTCYDSVHNMIWTCSDFKIEGWKNLGPAPKHAYSLKPSFSLHPEFTPEDVLSKIGYTTKEKVVFPLQAVLVILCNMDRLARQHPVYNERVVPEICNSLSLEEYLYCVEFNGAIYQYIQSILMQTLSCDLPDETKAYIILSSVRLLKINLYELSHSESKKKVWHEVNEESLRNLRFLIEEFVEKPPIPSIAEVSRMIQQESCSVLTIGLKLFYPDAGEQNQVILHLLENATKLTEGKKCLLDTLITQFAEWDNASEVLLGSETTVKTNKGEDNMELEEQNSKRLLLALIEYLYQEALEFIRRSSESTHSLPSPLVSPAVRLLLLLQRDILSDISPYSHLLLDYGAVILNKCQQLVTHVLEKYSSNLDIKILNSLQSSLFGCVIRSFSTTLCKKKFVANTKFATTLLPHLVDLIHSVDKLNQLVPHVNEADQRYLRRLTSKKDKKFFVESKHPYPQGKNQLKQTITIKGSEALCLKFDPRSKTTSTSSDILQLYKSASLSDPVISAKDGKPFVFSGNNWPKQSVIVPGDSVTFVFSVNTRPDSKSTADANRYRWGFKCRITGMTTTDSYEPLLDHWLLDLESSLALIGGKFSSTLIEGEPLNEKEKKCTPWLEANLLNGGLEEGEGVESQIRFLEDFINKKNAAASLCTWMQKHIGRRVLSALAKKPLETAERYVIATMLKHLCMVEDAIEFSKLLQTNEVAKINADSNITKFIAVAQEAGKIITMLQQKGQAEKEWRIAVEDKQSYDVFYNSWKDEKKEKLIEMCELKDVPFNPQDDKETIKALYEKLQDDINKMAMGLNSSASPYDTVSILVIERAKLLLKMRPARIVIEPPYAETPNPYTAHNDKPLTSSVPDTTNGEELPTLRASSYFPKTDAAISKEAKQAQAEQKSKAFTRRLRELRKWLQAYKSWKQWQEGALGVGKRKIPKSPLQAVATFVQSTMSTAELEELLKVHVERAKSRVQGLQYFHQLLAMVSFGSSRQQILSSMGPPLSNGGHYLDNIPTCGPILTDLVTQAFVQVFKEMVKILGDKNTDSTAKQLALVLCAMSYQESDIELLRTTGMFSLLQQLISECNQKISSKVKAPRISTTFSKDAMEVDKDPKEKTEENKQKAADDQRQKQKQKEQREREEKEELERQKKLRLSAWVAFRLLAARCVSWGGELDDLVLQTEALKELQDQVFDLMCSELKTLSQYQKAHREVGEDGDQCFELLSLLCLLGSSPKGYKSLSRDENLNNLISILKTDAEPRTKRLALRLCRKLLSLQTLDAMPRLIEFFLEEIGSNLYAKKSISKTPKIFHEHKPIISDEILEKDLLMEEEEEGEDDVDEEGSESEEEEDEFDDLEEDQYSVWINFWILGHQRLIEVCQNTLGVDFFGQPGSTFFDRHTVDSKAQQIIQEIADEGKSLLKTTSLANCNLLATAIAAVGGSVTVTQATVPSAEDKGNNVSNRNKKRLYKKTNPTEWINGQVAHGLASEYIYIVRHLLDKEKSSLVWHEAVKTTLSKAILDLPSILSGNTEHLHRAVAALSVLGGFMETLRVGGKVIVCEPGDQCKRGTVVELSTPTNVEVMLDSDSGKVPRKFPLAWLTPMSELDVNPSHFTLTIELINSLLAFIKPSQNATIPQWQVFDIKSRSLKTLQNLLQYPASAQLFIQSFNNEFIPSLLQLANSSKPSSRLEHLEKSNQELMEKLWDVMTKPQIDADDAKVKSMADILPFFQHSKIAELLPTTLFPDKLQGFIFRGEDRRKVEYIGVDTNPLGRRSYISRVPPVQVAEVVVTGNASISPNIPEYYFEVTIDQTDSNGSLISVGLCPEGAKTWGNGSYRYQANAKKTTFVGGNRRLNDYGTPYRAKNTIGCGWNRDEKTIFFTKDGVDQGPAFTNVNPAKFVPAIGFSKGVHLTVNFGQEPFKFKLVVEGETPEQREERKKLEEEKRKKDQEAEKERRKKEKEDERAANFLAAQPLMNMGFSLNQALVALKQTGFSGPEAASNWLVENMNSWNFDEAEEGSDKEEKEEEKEKEPEKSKEEEKPKEEVKAMEEEPLVIHKPKEEFYNPSSSQNFFLGDNFSFPEEGPTKENQSVNKLANEWEETVIPTIRTFMEKDNFLPLEVEDYLQQIRTQLANNNEQQARGIVLQILGDAGMNIQFPTVSASGKLEKPPMKTEEIKIGAWVTISQSVSTSDIKHWVPPMDKTLGQTGVVKAVDHHSNLILVQFYNPELATLNEWWYPVKVLEKPEQQLQPIQQAPSQEVLETKISNISIELANVYARRTIISLVSQSPLSVIDGPMPVKDILNLFAGEHLPNTLLLIPNNIEPSPHSKNLKHRLLELYEAGFDNSSLTKLLIKETVQNFVNAAQLDADATQIISSTKPLSLGAQHVKIEGAQSMVIVFDRAGTFIPIGSQATINFYEDEACSSIPIATFAEKSHYFPITLSSNEVWVKIVCQAASHRSNIKYKFAAVPVHPNFGLAFWLTDFLFKHAVKYLQDIPSACHTIFNVILDYAYSASNPSTLKESIFYLLSQLLQLSEQFPIEKKLPLSRLFKLRDEMVSLYEAERSRNIPYSTYLQSLIELMLVVKEMDTDNILFITEELLNKSSEKEEKQKKEEKPLSEKDEELQIAIALANSMTAAKVLRPETEPKTQEVTMDDDLATALALSLSSAQEKEESSGEPLEKEKDDVEPLFEDTKGDFAGMDIEFEDDDADMKVAMALSLQAPTKEEKKEESNLEEKKETNISPPATNVEPIIPEFSPASPSEEKNSLFTFGTDSSNIDFTFGTTNIPISPQIPPINPPSLPDNTNVVARPKVSAKRSKSPDSKTKPKTETKPSALCLPWLNKLSTMKGKLDYFVSSREREDLARNVISSAWKATLKDNIKDRILLVDNLPLLSADKQEELQAVVKKAFGDIALTCNFYMPIDEGSKQLKGYAFLEVVSPQKVDQVVKKMNKHRLKAPGLIEDMPNLRSSLRDGNIPRGVIQVQRYTDLLKSELKDIRVLEFLKAKLVTGNSFTPACLAALTNIFNTFGGEKEGALIANQLNELQMTSNGKPLTSEQLAFAFRTYKSKPVGESKEPGLALEGFLDLYLRQCIEAPLDTWEEFEKLGYDLNLHRHHYITLETALASQMDWTFETDIQLTEYGELIYADCEVTSPIHLSVDHIKPFTDSSNAMAYPLIAKHSLPSVRLRFEILRQLNFDLFSCLPLVNFERKHENSFANLLSRCRTLMFHTCKMDFIYDVLDKTSVQCPQPTVTIDRLKLAAKKEKEEVETSINRTMFGIAFQQLRNTNPSAYRQKKPGGAEPHFSIKIVFKGENVQGEGGPYRQFFTDVSRELQGVLPLFIPCPNAQQGLGENRDKWIIAPSTDSSIHISMFEFLGILMGCSIRTGVLLVLDLPPFFWKPMVGISPESNDLKLIDESLFGTLKYFSECTKEELERDIDETFTTFLSDKTKVPLKEGGENIKVTMENREEYVRLVEKIRLHESDRQIAALRRGLGTVVPLHLLDICTMQDLEWKVCGKPNIDINLLKRHTMCSGVPSDASHITYFWNTLFEFNQQDRRGFLRFAWAQERLPVNDEEFERTKTRMMIKPFPGLSDPNSAFPKADTCFFNIMLPDYTSQRVLRERLLYAIYTDSHSMNADEPQEDELQTVEGRRRGQANIFDYSSESDSE